MNPNGIGKISTATSPDGIVKTFSYDAAGRSSKTDWQIGGTPGVHYAVDSTYDPVGRVQTVTYPAVAGQLRLAASYSYDALGALKTVTDPMSGQVYWTAVQRNAVGQVASEQLGNGLTTTRRYDARNRLRFIDTSAPSGTSIQKLVYEYEPNGNMSHRHDLNAHTTEDFDYDSLDRLKDWAAFQTCGSGACNTPTTISAI